MEAPSQQYAEIEDPDFWRRRGWTMPTWWTAELDEASPLARYTVATRAQADRLLYKFRNPEKVKAQARAREHKRKVRNAPKKITEHTVALDCLRRELARLDEISTRGRIRAEDLRPDGQPYVFYWDLDVDRDTIKRRIYLKEKALRHWLTFVDSLNKAATAKLP